MARMGLALIAAAGAFLLVGAAQAKPTGDEAFGVCVLGWRSNT